MPEVIDLTDSPPPSPHKQLFVGCLAVGQPAVGQLESFETQKHNPPPTRAPPLQATTPNLNANCGVGQPHGSNCRPPAPQLQENETRKCRECSAEFIFTVGEQAFFKEKGFTNKPARCKECRAAKKAVCEDGSRGGDSQATSKSMLAFELGQPNFAMPALPSGLGFVKQEPNLPGLVKQEPKLGTARILAPPALDPAAHGRPIKQEATFAEPYKARIKRASSPNPAFALPAKRRELALPSSKCGGGGGRVEGGQGGYNFYIDREGSRNEIKVEDADVGKGYPSQKSHEAHVIFVVDISSSMNKLDGQSTKQNGQGKTKAQKSCAVNIFLCPSPSPCPCLRLCLFLCLFLFLRLRLRLCVNCPILYACGNVAALSHTHFPKIWRFDQYKCATTRTPTHTTHTHTTHTHKHTRTHTHTHTHTPQSRSRDSRR